MAYVNVLDIIYPIGYVYTSMKENSPAELFGGVWEQIVDVFLRAGNDTEIGGEDEHTLTTAEMPSHSHSLKLTFYNAGASGGRKYASDALGGDYWCMSNSGGNQPHNNMPTYQNMYVWKRIE